MTEPKNELPECPEYDRWFYTARSSDKDMPYGTHLIYQVCNGDEKKFEIAESIMRTAFIAGMNTRPAKVVEGDNPLDFADNHCRTLLSFDLQKIVREEVKYIQENIWRAQAALTPESEGIAKDSAFLPRTMTEEEITAITAWYAEKHGVEGIAGKGDVDFFLCLKIAESVFDLVRAPQDSLLSMDRHLAAKTVQDHLSTLARPQEIDVESLVNEVTDKICTNPESSITGMRLVVSGIVQSAIDHLHSSGFLSGGKKTK